MKVKMILICSVLFAVFCLSNVYAGDNDFLYLATPKIESNQDIKALKVKSLEWEKRYYSERILNMQLKYLLQCWNDVDFQRAKLKEREVIGELNKLKESSTSPTD